MSPFHHVRKHESKTFYNSVLKKTKNNFLFLIKFIALMTYRNRPTYDLPPNFFNKDLTYYIYCDIIV